MADDLWSDVVFVSNFVGTDGDTSATDESESGVGSPHAITFVGAAHLEDDVTLFGNTVVDFSTRQTGDYLTCATSADWDPADGAFTFECWYYAGSTGTQFHILGPYVDSAGNRAWEIGRGSVSGLTFRYSTDGTAATDVTGTTGTWVAGWYHVCAQRDADGNFVLFLDGTPVATADLSAVTIYDAGQSLGYGARPGASANSDRVSGYGGPMRITKGSARYDNAGFTPPADIFEIGAPDETPELYASQQAMYALAEVIPEVNASQQALYALAEIVPPLNSSQQAVYVLASGDPCATRRCQVWRILRQDGEVFTFTSHDRPVTFRGEVYSPCDSLTASASEAAAGVDKVGDIELTGIISDDGISEVDLFAGLFDDAYVEVWLISWGDSTDQTRRLAAGWAGAVSHGEKGFTSEVLGPSGRLDQKPLTQPYTPGCRWAFGGSECGVDADALKLTGTVAANGSRGTFTATMAGVPGSAQYGAGLVVFTSGANDGYSVEVKSYTAGSPAVIELWNTAPFAPQAGDTFDLLPGCDRLRPTCKDVYANLINFGGFPDVPGDDALADTPESKY